MAFACRLRCIEIGIFWLLRQLGACFISGTNTPKLSTSLLYRETSAVWRSRNTRIALPFAKRIWIQLRTDL